MCGRYAISGDPVSIKKRFGIKNDPVIFSPHFNAAPGMMLPVIRDDGGIVAVLAKWGLIPPWAKDPKIGYKMINAREETLMEKPSFKRPFISKRCLVPVSGFYEWKHLGNEKTPYFIRLKNAELFSLAGLYETWTDVEERSQLSFTIITTGPNTLMQSIHDRMPVIIPAERESEWLDPANKNPESLHKLLIPYAADQMFAYPVSALVNNPENDSRDLMREIK